MMLMQYIIFCFLYRSVCCGYSFELSQLVEAIQMRTHNICFHKEDKSTLVVSFRLLNFLTVRLWEYVQ